MFVPGIIENNELLQTRFDRGALSAMGDVAAGGGLMPVELGPTNNVLRKSLIGLFGRSIERLEGAEEIGGADALSEAEFMGRVAMYLSASGAAPRAVQSEIV
jgi:hypothetical protein